VIPRNAGHERLYRGLLRLYPAAFRARFADEMVQLFSDQLRDARTDGAPVGATRTWLRTLGDLAVTAASEHARRDRTVAHSMTVPPSISSRVLGLVGIVAGVILLSGFGGAFPWDNPEAVTLRIVLGNVGAIAIVIAVHRRQASVAPMLALLAAVPALLANAFYAIWVLTSPPGEFGLIGFYAGIALWLTAAAFALVTLRLGVVTRWGALAVAIGSVLAVTGIDRLGLTATFGPLSQFGLVLSAVGWILLGLDVAIRRRPAVVQPKAAQPGG
jgi:hypothetical protein